MSTVGSHLSQTPTYVELEGIVHLNGASWRTKVKKAMTKPNRFQPNDRVHLSRTFGLLRLHVPVVWTYCTSQLCFDFSPEGHVLLFRGQPELLDPHDLVQPPHRHLTPSASRLPRDARENPLRCSVGSTYRAFIHCQFSVDELAEQILCVVGSLYHAILLNNNFWVRSSIVTPI